MLEFGVLALPIVLCECKVLSGHKFCSGASLIHGLLM